MRHLLLSILVSCLCASDAFADSTHERIPQSQLPSLETSQILSSASSSLRARETAGPDTFVLYGGPDSVEGKFQTAFGTPGWQGWQGYDETKDPVYWQVSDHKADNLGGHGAGNLAYWCGRTAEQAPHFFNTPGYGSSWNAMIQYESDPVADPAVGQTVSLDFLFNYDVEPGYDALLVEIETNGTWNLLHNFYEFSGTNRDVSNLFPAPGVRFSDFAQSSFTFNGNDYGGTNGDRVRIRMRIVSDGAFDDQTGLWPTVGGACQIDDISVSHDGFSAFEDFEGSGPYLFQPTSPPFYGDFSEIFTSVTDIDPYRENRTPLVTFIDYGQTVRNGPGVDGTVSTGGSTSGADYGIAGDYVVNYTGGLGGVDSEPMRSFVRSPTIAWDLPGTDDDDPAIVGLKLRFDVFADLPLLNGIFYLWRMSPGEGTREFADDNTLYYSLDGPRWINEEFDLTEYLSKPPADSLRVMVGVADYAQAFSLPGGAATPAPFFDNVTVLKYRLDGVRINTVEANLLQNAFPNGSGIDASTQALRSVLQITPNSNSTLGSFEAEFEAFIDNTDITDVRAYWAMKKNPLFEDAIRVMPASTNDENVVIGPEIWTGERLPDSFHRLRQAFNFPLPNAFFPGDQLEFYIEATDDLGNVTTLPRNTAGFGLFNGTYDAQYHLRGLPSIQDASNAQPPILLYFGAGASTKMGLALSAMGELGMVEGVDFDVYFAPNGGVRRTLGDNANTAQLDGYDTIFVFMGGGSDHQLAQYQQQFGADLPRDNKGIDDDTLNLFTSWSALPGDRRLVFFGSHIGLSLALGTSVAPAYFSGSMGATRIDDDVRDAIGGPLAATIEPLGSGFTTSFVVGGSKERWCALDHLEPIAPAVRAHGFALPGSGTHATAAASILRVETDGLGTRVFLTFPFAFQFVQSPIQRAPVGITARAQLLSEILTVLSAAAPSGTPTATPEVLTASLSLSPNPFNPSTRVEFTLPTAGRALVQVYNVRGQLVRTLHRGDLPSGPTGFDWDGRDDRGASVATGVYVVRAQSDGLQLEEKALLIK